MVLLGYELLIAQCFGAGVAPQVGAHAPVQVFGKGFGQAVGECFEHDAGVVVILRCKYGFLLLRVDACGYGKAADVVAPCISPAAILRGLVVPDQAKIDVFFRAQLIPR